MPNHADGASVCIFTEEERICPIGKFFLDGDRGLFDETHILADDTLYNELGSMNRLHARKFRKFLDSRSIVEFLQSLEHFNVDKRLHITSQHTESLAVPLLDTLGFLMELVNFLSGVLDRFDLARGFLNHGVVEEFVGDFDNLGFLQEGITNVYTLVQ